ncbi:rodlin [Streptomyces natalensis]|uniref:rodlin n=1 Tax=Streptomyces natalensis TaxID=68242 RepID=UPI0004A9E27F|nr:rodlin [Streptomyces natalensis]
MKQGLTTAALILTVSGVTATPAMALSDTPRPPAKDAYGNSGPHGDMSPQGSLVTDSLNKLCLGIPIKANIQQLIGLVNIVAIQDIPILSAPQNQQCTDNSTQAKGDEPISHILDDIPVLSANGRSNE